MSHVVPTYIFENFSLREQHAVTFSYQPDASEHTKGSQLLCFFSKWFPWSFAYNTLSIKPQSEAVVARRLAFSWTLCPVAVSRAPVVPFNGADQSVKCEVSSSSPTQITVSR